MLAIIKILNDNIGVTEMTLTTISNISKTNILDGFVYILYVSVNTIRVNITKYHIWVLNIYTKIFSQILEHFIKYYCIQWMDGWMDGCVDGWMGGLVDDWLTNWLTFLHTFEWVHIHLFPCIHPHMDIHDPLRESCSWNHFQSQAMQYGQSGNIVGQE